MPARSRADVGAYGPPAPTPLGRHGEWLARLRCCALCWMCGVLRWGCGLPKAAVPSRGFPTGSSGTRKGVAIPSSGSPTGSPHQRKKTPRASRHEGWLGLGARYCATMDGWSYRYSSAPMRPVVGFGLPFLSDATRPVSLTSMVSFTGTPSLTPAASASVAGTHATL